MSVGPWQILLIVAIVLIFFGPSRIPGLGKSIGQAIRGFKKGLSEDEIDVTESARKEQLHGSPSGAEKTASTAARSKSEQTEG